MYLIYIFKIHEADVTHTDTKMRDGVGLGLVAGHGEGCSFRART